MKSSNRSRAILNGAVVSFAILFSGLSAHAEVFMNPVDLRELTFIGDDAAILHSIFHADLLSRKFKSTELSFERIDCPSDQKCTAIVGADLLPTDRSGDSSGYDRDEYNFKNIEFFRQFEIKDSDRFLSIPQSSFYYHMRENVLMGDKKLYEKLSNSRSKYVTFTRTAYGDQVALKTAYFEMKCDHYSKPKKYTVTAGHPHVMMIDLKEIKLSHVCRTYIKATMPKKSAPVFTIDANAFGMELLALDDHKKLVPVEGAKMTVELSVIGYENRRGNPDFGTFDSVLTNSSGLAISKKKIDYFFNDTDIKGGISGYAHLSAYSLLLKMIPADCEPSISRNTLLSRFVEVLRIDDKTGHVSGSGRQLGCDLHLSANGDHSTLLKMTPERDSFHGLKEDAPYYSCLLVGRGVDVHYDFKGTYHELESFSSGMKRLQESCKSKK